MPLPLKKLTTNKEVESKMLIGKLTVPGILYEFYRRETFSACDSRLNLNPDLGLTGLGPTEENRQIIRTRNQLFLPAFGHRNPLGSAGSGFLGSRESFRFG